MTKDDKSLPKYYREVTIIRYAYVGDNYNLRSKYCWYGWTESWCPSMTKDDKSLPKYYREVTIIRYRGEVVFVFNELVFVPVVEGTTGVRYGCERPE